MNLAIFIVFAQEILSYSSLPHCNEDDGEHCIECRYDMSKRINYGVDTNESSSKYGTCIPCKINGCSNCATDAYTCKGCLGYLVIDTQEKA